MFNACLTRKRAKRGRLLLSLLLFRTKKLKVTESSDRAWPTQWLSDRRINCGGGYLVPFGQSVPICESLHAATTRLWVSVPSPRESGVPTGSRLQA